MLDKNQADIYTIIINSIELVDNSYFIYSLANSAKVSHFYNLRKDMLRCKSATKWRNRWALLVLRTFTLKVYKGGNLYE